MVFLYAPWCGHCKHMKPKFAKIASFAGDFESPLFYAKGDITENPELASRFAIRGIPRLEWKNDDGEFETYEGEKEGGAILDFIHRKMGWNSLHANCEVINE